ncbi:MAG TPA: hypothetical protein VD906_05675 [Caulobacteraceae bacterium]|nr:hypothetical protein [Caulobacteraceae bacterium]
MSEPAAATPSKSLSSDERALPGIVYALYVCQFFTGFTVLIGVIMAYVCRDRSDGIARSHYDFLISTFWRSIPFLLLVAVSGTIGLVLSIVLIGIPILAFAAFLFVVICVWYLVRLVIGAVHLARGEAHPRPDTWLA